MFHRPTKDETEEDLLRLQQEFLASKSQPAAVLVRKPDKRKSAQGLSDESGTSREEIVEQLKPQQRDVVSLGAGLPKEFAHTTAPVAPPSKKSRFKEKRAQDRRREMFEDPEEALEKHDSHISRVLTEIVERDVSNQPVYYPSSPAGQGFPTVLHRGSSKSSGAGKAKSLFAQQFAQSSAEDFGIMVSESNMKVSANAVQTDKQMDITDVSEVNSSTAEGVLSTSEHRSIHDENQARLAAMSEGDVLAEQKKLLEMLDPGMVSFLRNRSQKNKPQNVENRDRGDTKPQVSRSQPEASALSCDLPVQPDKSWINMDQVEQDKLAWIKDLPPPPSAGNSKTGQPARFNFQGRLVVSDGHFPTHLGLHHHGEEPERAGYTLQELFQLARSANMQQRVIALNTMAKILQCDRRGEFHEMVSVALTPALIDGGLLFIIRWALDDSTENTMTAAINCLHALLVSPEDEAGVDQVFSWYLGPGLPSLCPVNLEESTEDEEKPQETDADILKRDIISGLLRMFLLPRLHYILKKWQPAASVVVQILDTLIRVARHSPQSAYEVIQSSSLIDIIVRNFLPATWIPVESTADKLENVYGYPVPQAMKLLRVICTAGRHMAASLISKYDLMNCIMRYITEEASGLQLLQGEADLLQLECLRTWQVAASYGLTSQQLSDMYPVLMGKLQQLSSIHHESSPNLKVWGTAIIGLLERMVHVAASGKHIMSQQFSRFTGVSGNVAEQSGGSPVIPAINWSHVIGLIGPMEHIMEKCLQEFVQVYPSKKPDLAFAASIVNFTASYYMKLEGQPGYNAIDTLEHLEKLCKEVLRPCLESQAFKLACQAVRNHSLLLNEDTCARSDSLASLPDFGALIGKPAKKCPLLEESCTIQFLLAVTQLLIAVGKLYKPITEELYPFILQEEELLLYVRKCCRQCLPTVVTNTFAKFENLLHYNLISLAKTQSGGCDMQLYHNLSLHVLLRLHPGDEHLAHDLLSTVIFNHLFIGNLESTLSSLSSLKLEEDTWLTSATQKEIKASQEQLVENALNHLVGIRNTYLAAVSDLTSQLHRSRTWFLGLPQEVERMHTGQCGQVLVPVDWVFLPLVSLYNRTTDLKYGFTEEAVSPAVISLVTDVLRCVFLLELWRPAILGAVTFATKLSRLMCIFLAGSDLFLDRQVHAYLASLLKIYCRPVVLAKMDFTQTVPGVGAFYDFYMLVLGQYEAVSFGDSLFGSFVLLPMQQKHSIQLRKAVWGEHSGVLRALRIPIKEIPIPLKSFLMPEETNLELLRLYFQALLSETVRPVWAPLPYLCAVHHVSRFFYTSDGLHQKFRKAMIKQVLQTKNKVLQHHLLYYKKMNQECENTMELYENLPQNRQQIVDQVKSSMGT